MLNAWQRESESVGLATKFVQQLSGWVNCANVKTNCVNTSRLLAQSSFRMEWKQGAAATPQLIERRSGSLSRRESVAKVFKKYFKQNLCKPQGKLALSECLFMHVCMCVCVSGSVCVCAGKCSANPRVIKVSVMSPETGSRQRNKLWKKCRWENWEKLKSTTSTSQFSHKVCVWGKHFSN